MNITYNTQTFTSRRMNFPTNGVLRCITGEVPDGRTENDIKNATDIWITIKKVFDMHDKDIIELKNNKDPLAPYLLTLGAGKELEMKNSGLDRIKKKLQPDKNDRVLIEREINKVVTDLGDTINLFI